MSSIPELEQAIDAPHGEAGRPDMAVLAALPIVDDEGAVTGLVPLARALAAADSWDSWQDMTDAEIVDSAAVFARLEAYAASGVRRAAAQLERRSDLAEKLVVARERNRDAAAGRDVVTPARTRVFRASETASDELMMRLGVSRRTANRLIAEGRAFAGCLGTVGDALSNGDLSACKAARLFEVLANEPLEVCLAVAEEIVPVAAGLTPVEVERRARRLLIEVDPAAAARRHERARGYRNVSQVQTLADGMARLTFTSTVVDVTAVHTACDLAARAAKADGDERTLDQPAPMLSATWLRPGSIADRWHRRRPRRRRLRGRRPNRPGQRSSSRPWPRHRLPCRPRPQPGHRLPSHPWHPLPSRL